MMDIVYKLVSRALPRRLVSHCVMRVLHTVVAKDEHPNDVNWFEALERFDPLAKARFELKVIK